MKYRRSDRLVQMTNFFLTQPHKQIPLTYFANKFNCAKSSISEDVTIVKRNFEEQQIGLITTTAGAAGGVIFIPSANEKDSIKLIDDLCRKLEAPDRILPGGYLYMMDIIGDPLIMNELGRIFASKFMDAHIDAVVTIATKGIPLAYGVANHLNVPVSIVRDEQRITEGSIVSINYVSGSQKRIQTMSLAKRSLKNNSNVLIIDDFMKAGGTIRGMMDLVEEFQCSIVGIGVLTEAIYEKEKLVDDYYSLIKLTEIDIKAKKIRLEQGNIF